MATTHFASKINKIIIPCGGVKADTTCAARNLYTGSAFREVLAAAIAEVGEENVLILSAKWGLLELDQLCAPYDVKMGDADAIDKREEGIFDLADQIDYHGLNADNVVLWSMLPKAYAKAFRKATDLLEMFPAQDTYEALLGIGEQKSVAKGMRAA